MYVLGIRYAIVGRNGEPYISVYAEEETRIEINYRPVPSRIRESVVFTSKAFSP